MWGKKIIIMLKYIFLLGRPGCGKSFVSNILTEKLRSGEVAEKFEKIDDFPVLKELLGKDKDLQKHIRKNGGFAITERSILNEALQIINQRLPQITLPKKIIFIEFARNNYKEALNNFSSEILKNSIILYIKTSFEICIKRNRERFKKKKNINDHIVPPYIMESYYKTDDIEQSLFKNKEIELENIFVLENDNISIEELKSKLDDFVKFYIKK